MRPQERFVGALQPSVHAVRQSRRGACVLWQTAVGERFCLFETSGEILSSSVTRRRGKRWRRVTSPQTTTASLTCARQARSPQVSPAPSLICIDCIPWWKFYCYLESAVALGHTWCFFTHWFVELLPHSSSFLWKLLREGLYWSGQWHRRVRRGSDEKVRTAQRITVRDRRSLLTAGSICRFSNLLQGTSSSVSKICSTESGGQSAFKGPLWTIHPITDAKIKHSPK